MPASGGVDQLTERALTEDQRNRLKVTLISLDPKRDTSAKLKEFAEQRNIDLRRWALVRIDKANVRKLAAVLGIQYRQLSSGEFNHSTNLILLDRDGRVLARTAKSTPAYSRVYALRCHERARRLRLGQFSGKRACSKAKSGNRTGSIPDRFQATRRQIDT